MRWHSFHHKENLLLSLEEGSGQVGGDEAPTCSSPVSPIGAFNIVCNTQELVLRGAS